MALRRRPEVWAGIEMEVASRPTPVWMKTIVKTFPASVAGARSPSPTVARVVMLE